MTGRFLLLALAGAVTTCDLATKVWAEALPTGGLSLLPGFDLRLAFNTGVSFGLFAPSTGYGAIVLVAAALAVTLCMVWLGWHASGKWERASYGLIIGGAVGNLLDRLFDGAVTDFLDLYVADWHFPTFNLADVSISCGVGLLLLSAMRRQS